jgi:hypothetical protein
MRSDQELALEELQRRMALKPQRTAQEARLLGPRGNHQEEQERPVSALRGLLDAVTVQSEPSLYHSALRGLIDGKN